ncbi:hypothetical protein KM043_016327 [Ampulex compressa]|nr:hypothetical protein KM043_016327 [Ampulex compressa]
MPLVTSIPPAPSRPGGTLGRRFFHPLAISKWHNWSLTPTGSGGRKSTLDAVSPRRARRSRAWREWARRQIAVHMVEGAPSKKRIRSGPPRSSCPCGGQIFPASWGTGPLVSLHGPAESEGGSLSPGGEQRGAVWLDGTYGTTETHRWLRPATWLVTRFLTMGGSAHGTAYGTCRDV